MPTVTPCLWFDTEAEEAATHYVSIFPRSAITDVTRYGPDSPFPEGTALTVSFQLDGIPFTALNGGPLFTHSEAVSFEIDCADQAEVDHYWDRLVEGGQESMCGWLKDRFGVSWQVVPRRLVELFADPVPARAQAATQAMMSMKRIDVAALEAAVDAVTA